jgi:hypothetical protein
MQEKQNVSSNTVSTTDPEEPIRQQVCKALIDSLGVANTLIFLQQLGVGYGDYTKEHYQWLDQLCMDDFHSYVRDKQGDIE